MEDIKPRGSASLAAVISAFVPTWMTGLLFIAMFLFIRQFFPNIYAPRTHMGTVLEKHQTPTGTHRWFDWAYTMHKTPDKFLLYHQSLDAYLYLRFLRTIIFIFLVGSCLTFPILMPINATGGGTSIDLDKIVIGNVEKKSYLFAHAVVACVFFLFIMFTIARERLWLIGLRQAWSLSKANASRLSTTTVLFLSAPREALHNNNMHRFFGDGAERVWPVTKVNALEALVAQRSALVERLEIAEVSLIQKAFKRARQMSKKHSSQNSSELDYNSLPAGVKKSIRPRHRPDLSPADKTVDTIHWLREQIKEKETEVEQMRDQNDKDTTGGAAVFVKYRTLAAAQQAVQQVASADLLALGPRYLGVVPKEVLWDNLCIPPTHRIPQRGIAMAIVSAIIVFWSIPSGLIGLVSNIGYLVENVEWLRWLNNLPDSLIELLSGLVPPLLTSLLSKYVPNLFRFIFRYFGSPTTVDNEMKVQRWFYIFQVTQVFLVTAVFSGAATVFPELIERAKHPVSIPELLARQLPTSSNYYLTYFIVQGITSASDNLLNYFNLLQYLVFGWLFDKTPRQKFSRYTTMKSIAWGKVYPKYANFAIIAIAYSCIAPLVMGFAAVGLALLYFSYRYNLLFVIRPKIDTRGQAYTLALQHLLTGVYIAELALIGIFSLRDAIGPLIITVILFIFTVLYSALMNKYLGPLEKCLPTDLTNEECQGRDESTPLLSSAEEGNSNTSRSSHIQRLSQQTHVPARVLDPIARFFEPHIFASYQAMKAWLREDTLAFQDLEDDTPGSYNEEELRKAYLNPALTSSTPLIWLPKDRLGVSENEIRENEEAGLRAGDTGAWLEENTGRVRWKEDDFGEVLTWKMEVKY